MGRRQDLAALLARSLTVAVLAFGVVATLAAPPADAGETAAATLRRDVTSALQSSTAGARSVSIVVESAGAVVDLTGDRPLIPASTQKLYTFGTALVRLDSAARLRTEIRAAMYPLDGMVLGDLVVAGAGDPWLRAADLDGLAAELAGAGLRQVTGDLRVDESRYDATRNAPGWKPGWMPSQCGPLTAFAVDRDNWRSDGPYLREPALGNGERLRQALNAAGIRVDGVTVVAPTPEDEAPVVLASRESATMAEIVRGGLKASDNFASELMLKELGWTMSSNGSTASGIEVVWQVATDLGLARGAASDGSGLSLDNRSSARHQVEWVRRLHALGPGAALVDGLAIACTDGTMKNRLCNTAASGRLSAKTGSLNGVVALTGTTTTAAGHRAWFAFLLNGVQNSSKARAAVDKAAVAIVKSRV